jgi:hypothetical protein
MGQNLGKSSNVIYDSALDRPQSAGVDMIQVEGDDVDAWQLAVTLHPPRVIPRSFDEVRAVLGQQNLSGEQTNAEVTALDFPGTRSPIRWPPLEAKILFGVGGVSTEVVADYVNGVSFSVCASFLRVTALVSQSRQDGDIIGTSAAYYLASHVGPGFGVGHVQRTIFVGDLDNRRESDVFDAPKFGRVASLSGCRLGHHSTHHAPSAAIGWIRFFQSPNGTHPVGDFRVRGHESRVVVPNGGMYFSVFNQSGHRMKMAVVFELAI